VIDQMQQHAGGLAERQRQWLTRNGLQ
jgi:hypothetical protein